MSLQTATTADFTLLISHWMRQCSSKFIPQLIDIMAKWPAAAQICSIANLWRGVSDIQYGLFISSLQSASAEGYNSLCTATEWAVITTDKQFWKMIPVPSNTDDLNDDESENVFYFQHLQSGKYLCCPTHSEWPRLSGSITIDSIQNILKIQ